MVASVTPPPRVTPLQQLTTHHHDDDAVAGVRTRWHFTHAFTIGRSRQCDVVIPTTAKTRTVSKLHARIFPMPDVVATPPRNALAAAGAALLPLPRSEKPPRWLLQDLRATNGTSINGFDAPADSSIELHDNDALMLSGGTRHGPRLVVSFPHSDNRSTITLVLDTNSLESPSPRPRAVPSAPPTRTSPLQPVAQEIDPLPAPFVTVFTATTAAPRTEPVPAASSFQTPSPSVQRSMTRQTSSTVAMKRERQQQRRSETSTSGASSSVDASDTTQRKRSRRLDTLTTDDPSLLCPICFEFYHASATLPCSHTFCGACVSSWFHTSLTCPQCRSDVHQLPVHNRALDDLVFRLVGDSATYKTLVTKRRDAPLDDATVAARRVATTPSREQVQEQQRYESRLLANPFDDVEAVDVARPSRRASHTHSNSVEARAPADALPNVYVRWSPRDVTRVRLRLATQYGEKRLQTCRAIGLTDATMERATTTQRTIAMQNLLADYWPYERVRSEGDGRLRIFMHFG